MRDAPTGIEHRFTQPDNWQWRDFTRTGDSGAARKLRYGYVMPRGKPDCVIVVLPGLGEFCEKYFEFARECLEKNRGFFVLDWVGQGLSTRYLNNPHKRHSAGFNEDIADLDEFISAHVKPTTKTTPLVMVAHSMGGNIGLRYIAQHSDMFCCAAFCAPMWGIKAVDILPRRWAHVITAQMARFAPQSYVPGGMDWHALQRPKAGFDMFSHDPIRGALYNQWCIHDPRLQVGGVTNLWLHEALKTCHILFKKDFYTRVKTPFIVAVAGKDALVSNKAIFSLTKKISCGGVIELPNARHEILMEIDAIRTRFKTALDEMIEHHVQS